VMLRDSHGVERNARVIFAAFRSKEVDIAVIELIDSTFCSWISICNTPARLGTEIFVIGRIEALDDRRDPRILFQKAEINCVEEVPLLRSFYHGSIGLSGAGVILVAEGGNLRVIGVHVGMGDDTVEPPKIKKLKKGEGAEAASVSENSSVTSSNIHGHSAYSLICEASRVHGLSEALASSS